MVSSHSSNHIHLFPPTGAGIFACPMTAQTEAEQQQRQEQQRQQARRAQRSGGMGR